MVGFDALLSMGYKKKKKKALCISLSVSHMSGVVFGLSST